MATAQDFVSALTRRDRPAALEIARDLLARDVALGRQWPSVARFAAVSGEWTLALAAIEKFVAGAPNAPDRVLLKAQLLAQAGRIEAARDLVSAMVGAHPDDGPLWHFLGTVQDQLGDRDASRSAFEHALRLMPASGPTWLSWASLQDFAQAPAALDRLRRADKSMQTAPAAARAPVLYALAMALEEVEDEGAFDAYEAGAGLAKTARPYSAEKDRSAAGALTSRFAASALPGSAKGAGRPIFVTGLPRSGTTLIEQILVSHSAVAEGAEVNLLSIAAERVGGPLAPAAADIVKSGRASDEAWSPFVRHYDHLLDERFGQAGRVVDKSLNTSRFAGMIGQALPDAPIIWLRRDPLDCAWSCFRTYFAEGVGWSFDLAAIGHHFAVEDALFTHWRERGHRILEVPYAGFVHESERWIGRILDHCDLPAESGVHRFHQTKRAVGTSSVNQVRQPIYARAIGSAAKFRSRLDPFLEAYSHTRSSLGLAPLDL